jgi:acyl-CoA thioesterase
MDNKTIEKRFLQDSFPQKLGIQLVEVAPGFAKVRMEMKDDFLNFHGIAHGGIIFTLADTAFGLASNSRGDAVALQVSINFISAVKPGAVIMATANEEQLTRKTGIYNIIVETSEGDCVALFRGTVYRKQR